MKKKQPGSPKRPPGKEYRFKIDAYSPETIPMARLAEYMARLAEMLGEAGAVHFKKLEAGSTTLVHQVEREAIPKVQQRAADVKRGEAPRDALRAFHQINKLLVDDNGVAVLREGKDGPTILQFPGREQAEESVSAVRQHGSVDGELIRIGGVDDLLIHITLESEGQQISGIHAEKAVAKRLGNKLFEYVRLHGHGSWRRDREGIWTLHNFKVLDFEVLRDVPLSTAVKQLRAVAPPWDDDAYEELAVIRHGAAGESNGGN